MARARHQEGSLKEQGNNWQGHYYVYDSDGKRHHRSCVIGPRTGADKLLKHEAQRKLREIVERETGTVIAPRKATEEGVGTLEWFWKTRFSPFKQWDPRTRTSIETIFRIHVLPKIGGMKLADVDKYQAQLLLQGLQHYSRSLVSKVKLYLKEMFEEALDHEPPLVKRNPLAKIKRIPGKPTIKRVLTVDEIQAFMRQLDSRDSLIVRMFLVLGFRPAELFGLEWDDYDRANKRMRIDKTYSCDGSEWKGTKTDGSNGWVALTDNLIRDLDAWSRKTAHTKTPWIFPGMFNKNPLNGNKLLAEIIRPAAIRAGIMKPRPKNLPKGAHWNNKATAVNFQVFRRSCATLMNATSKDVKATQAHLRHADPNTTLGFYIEEVREETRRAVEGLDNLLLGATEGDERLPVQ